MVNRIVIIWRCEVARFHGKGDATDKGDADVKDNTDDKGDGANKDDDGKDESKVDEDTVEVPVLRRNHLPIGKLQIPKEMLQGYEHNPNSPKRKRLRLGQVSAATS